MLRKRAFAGVAVLVLAFSLLLAPTVLAADAPGAGSGNFWTPFQTWVQDLLFDWFGWGAPEQNSGPVSPYDSLQSSDTATTTLPPPPDPVLVGPGDTSTTDEGSSGTPDG